MSDYYGRALLEDWLAEEVFYVEHVPKAVVDLFERYREDVERDIEDWMDSDDGDGNSLSWRGWGRGFNAIPDEEDALFESLVEQGKTLLTQTNNEVISMNVQSRSTKLEGITQTIEGPLKEGEYKVVGGSKTIENQTRTFLYTVGATNKIGTEVLFVSNAKTDFLKKIVRHFIDVVVQNDVCRPTPSTNVVISDGKGHEITVPVRLLITPLKPMAEQYCELLQRFYPEKTASSETTILVLEIIDQNRCLPGESGYNDTFLQFSHIHPELIS